MAFQALQPAAYAAGQAAMDSQVRKFFQILQQERNPFARANAAQQLGILLAAPHPVIPEVLTQLHATLLGDTNNQVRIMAANAIARINQKPSVMKLMKAISPNRGRTDVQLAIIRALGDMRQNSLETVPTLVRFLRSPNQYVREATVDALWKIRPKDPRVVQVLNQLLAEEEELVVMLTLTIVIADFKSSGSIPVLKRIVNDASANLDVKAHAQEALEKLAAAGIKPPPAKPAQAASTHH
ncbi:MAG: HEAT repeat domain-containing protein [Candidatus Sericytochromatia bacterium]